MRSLVYLIDQRSSKPLSITLKNCYVLDSTTLILFLHENLQILDISDCLNIKNRDLELIQRICPNLISLELNGCLGLTTIQEGEWRVKPLVFSQLRHLSIEGCINLKSVRLTSSRKVGINRDQNVEFSTFEILDGPPDNEWIETNPLIHSPKDQERESKSLFNNKNLLLEAFAIPALPNNVMENLIFPNLSLSELGTCARVCKAWNRIVSEVMKAFSHEKAFGPKEWYTYFRCHLKNIPRLPSNISKILNGPCPFWPNKKVHETHVLCLVPQTVNGQPLNLRSLGELVQKPLQGHATKYRHFSIGEYTDPSAPKTHWALMTRQVIDGSRNKKYEEEQAVLDSYSQKTKIAYEIPTILDASVCLFMEYVRSGTWLYGDKPWTYTWCQEKYNA